MFSLARICASLICFTTTLAQISPYPCGVGSTVELEWTITSNSSGDNRWIEINGQWPAPSVKLQCGQVLRLTVYNGLTLPTELVSIHFHGLLQRNGQTIMDGAQGLTQSGISPKSYFVYTVLADYPGTYWIHSHSPGQYPQGLRTPLIVTDDDLEMDILGYSSEQTITLSDWWPDFAAAEAKTTTKILSESCGNRSIVDPDTKYPVGFGIEYPPWKVTMNDVGGYNSSLVEEDKVVKLSSCADRKRLRFVNLSSHSRFLIGFSDRRYFEIVEIDGVAVQPSTADFFDIASGQRASIVVSGGEGADCLSAYIIAISDYKVSHGTTNCPMNRTNGDFPLQYTHGYLDVAGTNLMPRKPVLFPNQTAGPFPSYWLNIWVTNNNLQDLNTQQPPADSFDITRYDIENNKPQLAYQDLWWDPNNRYDYGFDPSSTRTSKSILGMIQAHDLFLKPYFPDVAWIPDKTLVRDIGDYMHYVDLASADTKLNSDMGGFPTMASAPGGLPGDTKQIPWTKPDLQFSPIDDSKAQFPTLFKMLWLGMENQFGNLRFWESAAAKQYFPGRTIYIQDDPTYQPHWFIIRSELGEHPMHLHGHHFQVLAKLPNMWFTMNRDDLYDHVADYNIITAGKANLYNPARRDTIMIEKGLTYVIAIKPDNPGVWAFHCHNDLHAVSGMFSQVIERPYGLRDILNVWAWYGPDVAPNGGYQMLWIPNYNGPSIPGFRGVLEISLWMQQLFYTAIKTYGWTPNLWTVAVQPYVAPPPKEKVRREVKQPWRRNLFASSS